LPPNEDAERGEHEQLQRVCNDAEDEATCELAEMIPSTTAGMLALLEYVAETEKRGSSWPDLYENDNDRWARSFLYFVSRNLAVSLRAMVA
jgi:hypothetical protein